MNGRIHNKLNFSHVLRYFLKLLGDNDYSVVHYDNIESLNEFELLDSDKSILLSTPRKVQVGININKITNVLFLITPLKFIDRKSVV